MKWLIIEVIALGEIAHWLKWSTQEVILMLALLLLANHKEIVSAVSQTAKATKT